MNVRKRLWLALAAAMLAALCSASPLPARAAANDREKTKADAAPAAAKKSEPTAAEKLAMQERRIANKYKHLEEVLLRMAELNAASDPAAPPCSRRRSPRARSN